MLLAEVERYENLELLARQVVEGFITGLHKSPFHGFSVEFAEHRQYNPGESIRNIDWKILGRTDRIYVKRFEEETNLRCRIVLDVSGSMYYPENTHSKLRYSVLAVASIMKLLKKQRDAFGLTLFSDKIQFQSDMRSSGVHYMELMQKLQPYWQLPSPIPSKGSSSLEHTLEHVAQTSNRRSLVVVFSDMLSTGGNNETLWDAIHRLRFQKNEVILYHIQHRPEEALLDFPSRPFRFTDIESGEQMVLNPAEIREEYQQKSAAYFKEMKTRAMQYRVDLHQADVSRDFHQVLLPFYLKRMRLT